MEKTIEQITVEIKKVLKALSDEISEPINKKPNMELSEAILHLDEIIPTLECECKEEHIQLKKWLEEFKELREKQQKEPSDYKDRFIEEYRYVCQKRNKLNILLNKYTNNELDFTPNCSYNLLYKQLIYMDLYISVLEERANIEKIQLWKI